MIERLRDSYTRCMDPEAEDDQENVVDMAARRREQSTEQRQRAATEREDAASKRAGSEETRRHSAGVRKFIAERRNRLGARPGTGSSDHGSIPGGLPHPEAQRRHDAEERERLAAHRDKRADDRERRADLRDEAADERERLADLRERELDERERRLTTGPESPPNTG
jgi:hypothetical protein